MNTFKTKIITTLAAIALTSATCLSSLIENVNSTGFAVYSGQKLSTGTNVSVDGNTGSGGSTWLANNTNIDGSVYSGTGFSTGSNVNITGSVTYGNSFWMGNNSSVGGDTLQGSYNIDSIDIPSISSGNESLWYKKDSTIDLDPGSYGSLSISKGSKVYLSSGTYDFKSVWFDKDIEIVLNTSEGDIIINSAGSFSTGQNVTISGDSINSTYIVSGSRLSLGNNNNIAASLISSAGISIDNGSIIDGIVYANQEVWLSNNVSVTGFTNLSRVPVPEPATALLLLSAFPFVLKKTRNNK